MKKNKKGRAAQAREAQKRAAGLEYELGRWKKAVDTRNTRILQLEGDLKLEQQKMVSNEALVALLLQRLGADQKHPIVLGRESVRAALSGYRVLVGLDAEKDAFVLHFVME